MNELYKRSPAAKVIRPAPNFENISTIVKDTIDVFDINRRERGCPGPVGDPWQAGRKHIAHRRRCFYWNRCGGLLLHHGHHCCASMAETLLFRPEEAPRVANGTDRGSTKPLPGQRVLAPLDRCACRALPRSIYSTQWRRRSSKFFAVAATHAARSTPDRSQNGGGRSAAKSGGGGVRLIPCLRPWPTGHLNPPSQHPSSGPPAPMLKESVSELSRCGSGTRAIIESPSFFLDSISNSHQHHLAVGSIRRRHV